MISHKYKCPNCQAIIVTEVPDNYYSIGLAVCPYCHRSAQEISHTPIHNNELVMADRIRELEEENRMLKEDSGMLEKVKQALFEAIEANTGVEAFFCCHCLDHIEVSVQEALKHDKQCLKNPLVLKTKKSDDELGILRELADLTSRAMNIQGMPGFYDRCKFVHQGIRKWREYQAKQS